MSVHKPKFVVTLALAVLIGFQVVATPAKSGGKNATEAARFVDRAETELELLFQREDRAAFLNGTDETEEHTRLLREASRIATARRAALAKEAIRFDDLKLPDDLSRKLVKIKLATTLPAPNDPTLGLTLSDIISAIETNYTSAANCTNRSSCRKKRELYDVIRDSRVPEELLPAWKEWHAPARAIRAPYQRLVDITNEGAGELGFADVGALWRSHYDMTPDAFRTEYERLWGQVRPLYKALRCHVRAKLHERYDKLVPKDGLIPAHLLGNMWAQFWTGIEPIVGPGGAESRIDVAGLLKAKGFTPRDMVRTGEDFFKSLGFPKLPSSFWDRSMFVEPKDRKVDCQASAWPIDPSDGDVRLKMCIKVREKDFKTIHHELGHIYYYLAYANQPFLFQNGANPGFHEAIGDTLALSITPAYYKAIGLLDEPPGEDADLPYLFRTALNMVPALAMSIVVDQYRWKVFSGEIKPENYNSGWWELRRRYQGLSPPTARTEEDFDAGMFYHVSYNVPYDRYFIAQILQFDFHRALCKASGHKGALHRCSIFGSQKAGERLWRALALGASRPWPDILEELTGNRTIDASSIRKYFAPVMAWLKEQNRGRQCEW